MCPLCRTVRQELTSCTGPTRAADIDLLTFVDGTGARRVRPQDVFRLQGLRPRKHPDADRDQAERITQDAKRPPRDGAVRERKEQHSYGPKPQRGEDRARFPSRAPYFAKVGSTRRYSNACPAMRTSGPPLEAKSDRPSTELNSCAGERAAA